MNITETELGEALDGSCTVLYEYRSYQSHMMYASKGDTVYYRKNFNRSECREWFDDLGDKYKKAEYNLWLPVATKREGVYIGYSYSEANLSNSILKLGATIRKCYYPNLYWVDIGNSPYPKEVRFNEMYRHRVFNKYCHKIIYAGLDPATVFLTDGEMGL
jgi:hypothetical protein